MPTPSVSTDPLIEPSELDRTSINTIRCLAMDAVQQANSGHPGMPMGAAAMAYVLWTRHLKHDPSDPDWADRDRFILSAGHGSMLLYALLHLTGYDLSLDDIKNFRQWGSKTPGHPESHLTPGVETTTGPLGQGFATGVGMAMAERYLAAHFNTDDHPLVDHYTYGIVSDGDLMEGISSEAASLAGHQGLGRLIYLYDDNEISIDGSTNIAFTEDVPQRFEAMGWHVHTVGDGNDLAAIDQAIRVAKSETKRPSLLCVRTNIGYGSPNKQDTAAAHGAPLGEDEIARTKKALGWPSDAPAFHVPEAVEAHMHEATATGREAHAQWDALYDTYESAHPEQAETFNRWMSGTLPTDWDAVLPAFETGTARATRAASGTVLDHLVEAMGAHLVGGSADLTGSNKTHVDGQEDMQPDAPGGSYVRYGVREHAMAAAANGMALHGGVRPYVGTFLIFSDYLRPALRLSGLMEQPVTYVLTHDSIGLGEDGPTHQPVEHLAALRSMPNVTVIRPADGAETAQAWRAALENTSGPTVLALTRQGLPELDHTGDASAEGVQRGAYVLRDTDGTPDAILMGSGSEVQHLVAAANTLSEEDNLAVRVVSVPSWELFDAQSDTYQRTVLPPDVTTRVAMEAGCTQGWHRYVGDHGRVLGIDRFGASAPGDENMRQFGFTPEHVVDTVRELKNA
mgnify:FL=1